MSIAGDPAPVRHPVDFAVFEHAGTRRYLIPLTAEEHAGVRRLMMTVNAGRVVPLIAEVLQ